MRYEKGESGNRAGRPRGIKDKRTALRALLEPHADELVAKVVEMAKAGDTTALRICIDRLIPPAKAREEPVTLPLSNGSLAEKGQAVLTALGEGAIAPDVATAILQGIAVQARIVEVDEIEKRLTALEGKHGRSR
jgi:Family of unknown function (DUF5681)